MKKRLFFTAWALILIFLTISGRFFYIQIIQSKDLQERVSQQRVKDVQLLPERGKIFDRNNYTLATSINAQDVAIHPNLIESKDGSTEKAFAKKLSTLLEKPELYDDILNKALTNEYWASVAKRVEPEIAMKIKKENFHAVQLTPSPKRHYPNGDIGGSFLGFVNHQNIPGSGIEYSLNQYLSGVPGYKISEISNSKKTIATGFENIIPPQNGQDVYLTIDSYIQYLLEKRMKEALDEMNPRSIHGIVMNPNNGDVLAMASYPSFDPNNYTDYDMTDWNRSPVSWSFEPGSTFKPIFMALALEEKTINPNVTFNEPGYIELYDTTIYDWNRKGWGEMGLKEIMTNSSNVGMIKIAQTLSNKQVIDGLLKSGFGQYTNIKLPGETKGIFPTEKQLNNDPIRKATISFGQGISVTPIQLITSFSEVINGGYSLEPKIVDKIIDENENTLTNLSHQEKIYSEQTTSLIKSYLKANMEEGSGENYQLDNYDSGGKTGSAWIFENGKYKENAIIGSFLGFAPYDNPKYSFLIIVEEPEDIEFGSEAAGPLFRDVMNEILYYSSIPNLQEKAPLEVSIPDVKWMLYEEAKKIIEDSIKYVFVKKIGDGEVVCDVDFIYKNHQFYVYLKTKKIKDEHSLNIPSFQHLSINELMSYLSKYNITPTIHGNGRVIEQNLTPGSYDLDKNLSFWLK